jgi:hypothetical protein
VAGRNSSPRRQDENEGAGTEVKGEPPADAQRELDRRRERRSRADARLARSRRRGAAAGARPPSSRREPPTREDSGGRRRADAGLGRKGGEPAERVPRRRGARESPSWRQGGGGAPRPRRAAPAASARSSCTHHGRRRNRREWKGGAAGITDRGSVRAEVTEGGRSGGGGGGWAGKRRGGAWLVTNVGAATPFFYFLQYRSVSHVGAWEQRPGARTKAFPI